MSIKLKPSTKEYKRDSRGKIIGKKFSWRHHNPCSFKTEELKLPYKFSDYKQEGRISLQS